MNSENEIINIKEIIEENYKLKEKNKIIEEELKIIKEKYKIIDEHEYIIEDDEHEYIIEDDEHEHEQVIKNISQNLPIKKNSTKINIDDILSKIKETRKITESSLKLYERNIRRLILECDSIDPIIFTSDETILKVSFSLSPSTKANYLATCLVVLGLDKNKNIGRIEQLNLILREINIKVKNGTKKKDKEIIKWDDIIKVSDLLRYNFGMIEMKHKQAMEALLLNFYTLFPAQRSEIFSKLIITNIEPTDRDNNYLYCKSPNIYFLLIYKHKTVRTNGFIIQQINNEKLIEMLNRYIIIYKTKYVFQHTDEKSFLPADISRILNKITKEELGCELGSSSMRHIYLSYKYSNVMKDLKEDTNHMGNSINVALSNYIK